MSKETARIGIEAKVVTEALLSPETIPDMRRTVTPGMFSSPVLKGMWVKILEAWDDGAPLDEMDIM